MSKRKLWARSVGKRGHRVRVYEARRGGNLMRSVYINGKEDRRCLGHTDRELAVRQAHELVAAMLADSHAVERGSLELGTLARLYCGSSAHAEKKPRTQEHDERKLARLVAFLGPQRDATTLCESDILDYYRLRRVGDASLVGVTVSKPVSNRTVQADVVALLTALRWAVRKRTATGRRLLKENPLEGVELPRERNPKQPVMRHDTYIALLDVAASVHPLLRLGLVIAEGTGRRLSAWRCLRWSDVDFASQAIRWRAENDKAGKESVVPMSDAVRDALLHERVRTGDIGKGYVFPSPRNPTVPCDRHVLDNWLRRAFAQAGRQSERGGMWHTLRRKWVTERKHYSVKDIAAAGGWEDADTVLRCYLQADEETVRRVVLHPTHRLTSSA